MALGVPHFPGLVSMRTEQDVEHLVLGRALVRYEQGMIVDGPGEPVCEWSLFSHRDPAGRDRVRSLKQVSCVPVNLRQTPSSRKVVRTYNHLGSRCTGHGGQDSCGSDLH